MPHEMILTEQRGRVATVTFNRPDNLNAMHPVMLREMFAQVQDWNRDQSVGAIVITGAGRAFCAGADVSAWARAPSSGSDNVGGGTREFAIWPHIARHSKPLIAAINGVAVGWGLTMSLCCDVRIASEQARLSARFLRAGVTPELGSSTLLPRIVGWGRAMELIETARIVNAQEAAGLGLVARVVPHEQLLDEAVKLAAEIASNPTEGLYAVKRLLWATLDDQGWDKVMQREDVELRAATQRPTFREAARAFVEKRAPDFHQHGMD